MWKRVAVSIVAILAAGTLQLSCKPADPLEATLKERARWKVDVLSFSERQDGSGQAQFRLSGPVQNNLATLTVRIDMIAEDGAVIESVWHSFDVEDIQRGVTTERVVTLPATAVSTENLSVDRMLTPTADQIPHIPELAGPES